MADLKEAVFTDAHLKKAQLGKADLREAFLWKTNLEEADLMQAQLEDAYLGFANLTRANLSRAHLEGADLQEVFFDKATQLSGVTLGSKERGFAYLADCHWNGVNLAVVNWSVLEMLGEEHQARQEKTDDGRLKEREERLAEYQKAVRANRQLAVALREQGMSEEAARFAYQAQVLQRQVLLLQIPQRQQQALVQLFFLLAMVLGGLFSLSFLFTMFPLSHSSSSSSGLYSILTCSPWDIYPYHCSPIQQQIVQWIVALPSVLACVLTLSLGLLLLALFPEAYLLRKSHQQETLRQVSFSVIVLLLGVLLTVVSLVLLLPQLLLSLPFPLLASPFLLPFASSLLVLLSKGFFRFYRRMIKTDKQNNRFLHFFLFLPIFIMWLLLALFLINLLGYWFLIPLSELFDLTTIVLLMLPSFMLYLLWRGLLFIRPINQFKQRVRRRIRNTLALYGQYALSLFLDAIAGYGYKPERSLGWYIVVIIGFAIAASSVGAISNHPLIWHEALVFSITSFHGRGFFSWPRCFPKRSANSTCRCGGGDRSHY